MHPNKNFFLNFLVAMLLFSFSANGNTNSEAPATLPCSFEISISSISVTSGGVLLKVISDGQCGFTELDPSIFGITWMINGVNPFGGTSNLVVAPFETGIEVTVKNILTGDTAKAWIMTPAQQVPLNTLPGFSSQDSTEDF